jgi:hypothetical protein
MAKAIQNGTAIAVSDGSYKDGRGAAAFILETSNQFQTAGRIVGVNSTPGETEDQSSYRSKLEESQGSSKLWECCAPDTTSRLERWK